MKKETRLIMFSICFVLLVICGLLINLYLVTVPKIKSNFTEQECEVIKNELCINDKSYLEISKILDYSDIIFVQIKINDINACIRDNANVEHISHEEYSEILKQEIKNINHQKNVFFETDGIRGLELNDKMSMYNVDGVYYLVMAAYDYNYNISKIANTGKRCYLYKRYSYTNK